MNSQAPLGRHRRAYIYRRPAERSNFLGSWISRLVSRIRSFSIATTGIPEDRSFSPFLSPSPPPAVLQDDATVVRKRRATEDDRRFRRDKWRVSGGYFDSGTIALGNDRPPPRLPAHGPFASFSASAPRPELLISWLKMSDTRTIGRACASPAGSRGRPLAEEKNNRAYERTTDKTAEGKEGGRSSTRDPGLKSLYEAMQLDRSYFPPRAPEHRATGYPPQLHRPPRARSPRRPISPPCSTTNNPDFRRNIVLSGRANI